MSINMDRVLQKALHLILISAGLAVVFNFLFFGKMIGISVFIFVAVLLGTVLLFGLYQKLDFQKSWWLAVLILFFALMPGIRDSEFLTVLNVFATFGLLMLLAHELAGTPTYLMKIGDYVVRAVLVPLRMIGGAFSTISQIGQIHSNVKHRDVWIRVIKGAILAVPVLIIFGVLFSQADLAFSQFLKGFVNISVDERSVQYLVLLVFAFIAGLSYLSYIFFPKQNNLPAVTEESDQAVQSGREIEVMVFLGLIAALFLLFIGFQITYLFGGEANIINAGFTYAEYARRGFWELLAVAMLSLLVLLASEKYAGVESKKDKQFLIPALVLIAEVGIVIVSAFKRLTLYIDAYGMTLPRFYVAAIIILLLVLFILLAVKFIMSKREQFFTFGTLLSVVGMLVLVNVVNPDALIIRSNIEQYNRTGKLDVSYIADLSSDAESGKIELYNKLQNEEKEYLRVWLENDKERLEQSRGVWQSANLSRTRAMRLLYEMGE